MTNVSYTLSNCIHSIFCNKNTHSVVTKKKLTLQLLLFIPYLLFSQTAKENSIKKDYYSTINYETANTIIIIPAIIEGNKYRFILDTGAPCTLSKEVSEYLKLTPDSVIPIQDVNNKMNDVGVTTLSNIVLGGVRFDSIAVILPSDKNIFFNCLQVDGIIGSNLFKSSILKFNAQKKQIIITDNLQKLKLDSVQSIDMDVVGMQKAPIIILQYKYSIKKSHKVAERVLFDTGCNSFYSLSMIGYKYLESIKIHPKILRTTPLNSTYGLWGLTQNEVSYTVDIPLLKLGNTLFKNIAEPTNSGRTSLLGAELLKYGDVTVDFIHQKFYFESYQDSSIIDLKEKYFPFHPNFRGDTLIVGTIWDKKLKKRMNTGDQILSFNNVDFTSMKICDYLMMEEVFADDKGTFRIQNKEGEIVDIYLEKEYLKKQKIH